MSRMISHCLWRHRYRPPTEESGFRNEINRRVSGSPFVSTQIYTHRVSTTSYGLVPDRIPDFLLGFFCSLIERRRTRGRWISDWLNSILPSRALIGRLRSVPWLWGLRSMCIVRPPPPLARSLKLLLCLRLFEFSPFIHRLRACA